MLAKKNSLSLKMGPPALAPKSFRWYLGFTVLPQFFVQGAVVFERRLDLNVTLNRITVDLVKMF